MKLFRVVVVLIGAILVALASAVGLFAFAGASAQYPFAASALVVPPGTVAGAYHVHSTASDGRGTPEEIAKAAAGAGLAFVVLTDHNLRALPPPRFESGVLLVFGVEWSTRFGHLVALGLSRPLTAGELSHPIESVRRLGGDAYLAHPVQVRNPWTDWSAAEGATGIELYSGDSMLRDAEREPLTQLLPALGAYLTNPQHAFLALVRPQPEATRRLLELSSQRAKVALCAHDAHGLPPYDEEFRALAMYLPAGTPKLQGDPEQAAQIVRRALASGGSHCVFRVLGEGTGFALEGLGASGRQAKVGQLIKIHLPKSVPAEARVEVAGPARVLPDGRSVLLTGAGAVQIEIWRRAPGSFFGSEWKPWLVPSPILVVP